jgi:hypothetical protein
LPAEPKPPRWIEGFDVAGAGAAEGRADGAGAVEGRAAGGVARAGGGENDEPPKADEVWRAPAKADEPAPAVGCGPRGGAAAKAELTAVTASGRGRELSRPAANGTACQRPPAK